MKLKRTIKERFQEQPDVLEQKIDAYLKKYYYRVVETGKGYVIFKEDEFSDREKSRSDYRKRIDEGKFEVYLVEGGTEIKLTYFIPVLFLFTLMMFFVAVGMYAGIFAPIIASLFFILPVLNKISYFESKVFDDINGVALN